MKDPFISNILIIVISGSTGVHDWVAFRTVHQFRVFDPVRLLWCLPVPLRPEETRKWNILTVSVEVVRPLTIGSKKRFRS